MNETRLSQAAEKTIDLKVQAIDILLKELVEPIAKVGNPESIVGKKYEEWSPEDFQRLGQIYGPKEPNPLSNLIFKKKLEEVLALEREAA